jgi:hypothetical protein
LTAVLSGFNGGPELKTTLSSRDNFILFGDHLSHAQADTIKLSLKADSKGR